MKTKAFWMKENEDEVKDIDFETLPISNELRQVWQTLLIMFSNLDILSIFKYNKVSDDCLIIQPTQEDRLVILREISKFNLPAESHKKLFEIIEGIYIGVILHHDADLYPGNEWINELHTFHGQMTNVKAGAKVNEITITIGGCKAVYKEPETLERLISALTAYPTTKPAKSFKYAPGRQFKPKDLLTKQGLNTCMDFIQKYAPGQPDKEKYYFSALVMSLAGLVENFATYDENLSGKPFKNVVYNRLYLYRGAKKV